MMKKQERYCELCGSQLNWKTELLIKNEHAICTNCFKKYKRKGDPFLLTKIDIKVYNERKTEEEKEKEKEKQKAIEEAEKQAEEKRKEEERINALPDEVILDEIVLIGNRNAKKQEALDLCSEDDDITIAWEYFKDEEGFDVQGSMLIAFHDYSSKEIGRFKEADQKKLIELEDDYTFDGKIEKIGEKENGSLFCIIKIIAKKEKTLDKSIKQSVMCK